MKKYLGSPADLDVEKLKIDYEKQKDENMRLKKQVEELQKEVMSLTGPIGLIILFTPYPFLVGSPEAHGRQLIPPLSIHANSYII